MKEDTLNEEQNAPAKTFRRRQFQKDSTRAQKLFDWIFGIALPVAWFSLDPVVFHADLIGKPLIPGIKPFVFILSFVSIMAMAAWLLWGAKLKGLNAGLAGLFLAGGAISVLGGLALMPFSVLSLFTMGLTPMFTIGLTALLAAFVFLRNFYRAFDAAKPFVERNFLSGVLALCALLSVVVPMVVSRQINKSVREVVESDAQTIRAKAPSLKKFALLADFDQFRRRYEFGNPGDEERKALVEAYQQLTGESLEKRVDKLNRHRNL